MTGVGFQPVVVFVKGGSAALQYKTNTMGTGAKQFAASGFATNVITSLDTDGFTLGTAAACNTSGTTYRYLALGDDGSSDIVASSYTGTGVAHTETVAGISTLDVVIVGNGAGAASSSWATSSMASNAAFNGAGTVFTTVITGRSANTFDVGTGNSVNTSGTTYHVLALKNVTGYFKVFTYTGATGDNRNLNASLGFTPTTAVVKANFTTTQSIWKFSSQAGADLADSAGSVAEAANLIQDFIADGLQLGTDDQVNRDTTTYYGFAFKSALSTAASTRRPSPIFFL